MAETSSIFHVLFDHLVESEICKGPIFIKEKENAVNKGHMTALQAKHAELEAQLETENARPHPDEDLIHRLKKLKLQIKDQLTRAMAPA